MLFKSQLVVLGAKSSKGEYNGVSYDSTTVFFQADLQDGDNFCGQVGESLKWGTSANFEKIKNLDYPLHAEATLEQVSNGKTMITIIKDLVPQVKKPA
ncbi:hypothetical protein [Acinetobacter sp. ANC 4641]|uniref:hypothetical protein n=1 Tax=Acinetobacter sp. ANC 4641 TaxID=2529847 RepID=UPI00103B2121|nr:hypothetical protein [Acinetobacter sp. ANC 4641]TCB11518.1 hypothetical protein E0H78_07790 [Acinetobacter sp. ANC 4641]